MQALNPTSGSPMVSSDKFKVPCQQRLKPGAQTTDGWLKLIDWVFRRAPDIGISRGILDQRTDVVVKLGDPSKLAHEYNIAKSIQLTPNFMKYYCFFSCPEDLNALLKKDVRSNNTHICKESGDALGVLMMPYYGIGSVLNYKWTMQTLPLFKSVLCQAVFALLTAFNNFGLMHNDLHLDNVLLQPSKRRELSYGNMITLSLPTSNGLYAVIMDFERSYIVPLSEDKGRFLKVLYTSIRSLLNLSQSMAASDIVFYYDPTPINAMISNESPITVDTYSIIKDNIDSMVVQFEKSKLPPMPRW
jgi:hypothetical protein